MKEMKIFRDFSFFLLLPCILLFPGEFIIGIHAFSYNYYATNECLLKPGRVQYGGGIIVNPEFNNGIKGWKVFGKGEIKQGFLSEGNFKNSFIIAHRRARPRDSFLQMVQLQQGKLYSFSAWIRVSEGEANVAVLLKNSNGVGIYGGKSIAKKGCWTLLKGGFVSNFTGPAQLLFESIDTGSEIWVDNVSLQPFTKEQWRSHQDKSIEKMRKSKLRMKITQENNKELKGAKVSFKQIKPSFPFGCGMNYHILQSKEYQKWFASRFYFTTFTNELKWYSTEKIQGQENYTVPDAMLDFARKNGISVRGHNILWDDPEMQPQWVKSLSSEELKKAADRRINSVVSRYAGKLIAWDVVNENLHFSFFEDKLGKNASAVYFNKAYNLDKNPILFMNEFNIMVHKNEKKASPAKYKKKLRKIMSFPGNKHIRAGIGLQGNFGPGKPNLPYMRSTLDFFGKLGYPIWITEIYYHKGPHQAKYYEEVLREGYSHPAVKGIITFGGPESAGFKVLPLVDKSFKNTKAGDTVDKLISEWKSPNLEITSDDKGFIDVSLFHGDYNVTVKNPQTNSSISLNLSVTQDSPHQIINVHV